MTGRQEDKNMTTIKPILSIDPNLPEQLLEAISASVRDSIAKLTD